MSYPTKDDDYKVFTIGKVAVYGDNWLITAQNSLHSALYPKSATTRPPRVGNTYRLYGLSGEKRGIYVGRRKIFYNNPHQHRLLIQQSYAKKGLRLVHSTATPLMKRGWRSILFKNHPAHVMGRAVSFPRLAHFGLFYFLQRLC